MTAESLKASEMASASPAANKTPSVAAKSKKSKASAKPAWAMTEKMTEDAKEDEIDQLLEFAYELDYEKYMEDYEVR